MFQWIEALYENERKFNSDQNETNPYVLLKVALEIALEDCIRSHQRRQKGSLTKVH